MLNLSLANLLEFFVILVTSCTPPLDCIAEFQLKVRETNNFSAFVANIRKAFVDLSHKQSA